MTLTEKLLLLLSAKPEQTLLPAQESWELSRALSILRRVFPHFMSSIVGKHVLDYGCGDGHQVVALAKSGAHRVVGLDTSHKALKKARELARSLGLERQVEFTDRFEESHRNRFDVVISQNSMEHFGDPVRILEEMKSSLKQGGVAFVTFGPPWFAPYGSHMQFFTKVPWVNIIFSEQTVMNVRARFRSDGARRYEDIESGLNRMTVRTFERILSCSSWDIQYRKCECVKGMNFIGGLPLVRELFVNHISCTLRPRHAA